MYSPFLNGLDLFYISQLNGKVTLDSNTESYKLEVCEVNCNEYRSATQLAYLHYVGSCHESQCYAELDDQIPNHGNFFASELSKYMLMNSNMTFIVTNISGRAQSVELYIFTNVTACKNFFRAVKVKPEMIQHDYKFDLSKANNFTTSFIVPEDGYYCPVWRFDKDTRISFKTFSAVRTFNVSRMERKCTPYDNPPHFNFTFHNRPSLVIKRQSTCVVIVQNYRDLTNLLVESNAVSIPFNFAVVISLLFLSLAIGLILMTLSFWCCCVCYQFLNQSFFYVVN